jgi:hypothetical protein
MWRFLKWLFILPEPTEEDPDEPWIFGDGGVIDENKTED